MFYVMDCNPKRDTSESSIAINLNYQTVKGNKKHIPKFIIRKNLGAMKKLFQMDKEVEAKVWTCDL